MRGAALGLAAVLTWLPAAGRAQALPEGECAGVYWDLTASFATGDRLYARVLVTRAGPGERAAAGLGHWIEGDGHVTPFQNGRAEGRFELDPAGPQVRIGSTRLDLAGPTLHFEVDNDKRGVKIAVAIAAGGEPAPDPLFPGDPEIAVLALGRPAEARLWRSGMDTPRAARGTASLLCTRHRACERDLLRARVDVHRLGDPAALLLVSEHRLDGSSRSWLGWRAPDGRSGQVRPTEVLFEDWRPAGTPDATPLPGALRLKGRDLAGRIAVGPARLSIDPLDALPRGVRMLYWFADRPRRLWADATLDWTTLDWTPEAGGAEGADDGVATDARAGPPDGAAIATFTFLRPPDEWPREPDSGG